MVSLSQIVRLGAGSATRSLAGGFAIWYANKNGLSYAERLPAPNNIDFSMVIIPIHSHIKTDEAHAEVLSSPLFKARLRNINGLLEEMKKAIERGDTATIGKLAGGGLLKSSRNNDDGEIAHGALGARHNPCNEENYSIKRGRNHGLVFH